MTTAQCWSLLMLMVLAGSSFAQEANTEEQSPTPRKSPTFEVEFVDDGHLRLALEVDKIDFETPHGKLSIPVAEIRSLELALRLTDSERKQLDAAIFNLGSSDFAQRNDATTVLIELGEKAYPAVVKAAQHADLEVAHRAQELATKMRATLSEDELEQRDFDVIETEHSRIAGHVSAKQLHVRTTQFGKQALELSAVRSIVGVGAPQKEEASDVLPDPGNLLSFHGSIGKTLVFRVTGRADGSLNGTGIYTTDSNLGTAAVHTGLLKPGETGIVRVLMMPSPPAFSSSTQNGITSTAWETYTAAYQIVLPKKKR